MEKKRRLVPAGKRTLTKESIAVFTSKVIDSITKVVGGDSVSLLSDDDSVVLSEVTEWIPTGFSELDYILTKGKGIPIGKAVEFFGKEASGKSALSQYLIRRFTDLGGIVVFVDYEMSLDLSHISTYSIPKERFIYVAPDTLEEGWDVVFAALDVAGTTQLQAPMIIIWDSVAQSCPYAETVEESSGDSHVGLAARMFSKGCRKLMKKLPKCRASMIFINQVREKIGIRFGDKTARPGGYALDFACSTMLRFRRVKTVKSSDGATPLYYIVEVETSKNRLAPPHQKAQFVISFKHGPDPILSTLETLKRLKLLRGAGKYLLLSLPGEEDVRILTSEWYQFMGVEENEQKVHNALMSFLSDTTEGALCGGSEGKEEASAESE